MRFSAQQAILVDILLILPGLLESLIPQSPTGLGLALMVTTYNTIWLYVLCCTAGGVASCLLGKKILLPLVGEAADAQTM